jgi:hypothetical protein
MRCTVTVQTRSSGPRQPRAVTSLCGEAIIAWNRFMMVEDWPSSPAANFCFCYETDLHNTPRPLRTFQSSVDHFNFMVSNFHEDNPSPPATARLYVLLPEDTPSQRAVPAVLNSSNEPHFTRTADTMQKRERANKVGHHKVHVKERPIISASNSRTSPPTPSRLQLFSSKAVASRCTAVQSALRLRGKIARQQSLNEERSTSSSGLWGDANHVFVKTHLGEIRHLPVTRR